MTPIGHAADGEIAIRPPRLRRRRGRSRGRSALSGPHRVVRLLAQAALQAALREQGKAWGAYELNHALVLALDQPDAKAAWSRGEDPLAEAAADLELREAMAAGFDEMRGCGLGFGRPR